MKPGRPTTFAVRDGAWCFGLPGNPVSSFLQFEALVRPLLVSPMGGDPTPRTIVAPLAEAVSRGSSARQAWLPVRLTADGEARPLDYHGSGHIHALCHADGFIVLPVGRPVEKEALVMYDQYQRRITICASASPRCNLRCIIACRPPGSAVPPRGPAFV
jgi:molybdopterin molybdotransferase